MTCHIKRENGQIVINCEWLPPNKAQAEDRLRRLSWPRESWDDRLRDHITFWDIQNTQSWSTCLVGEYRARFPHLILKSTLPAVVDGTPDDDLIADLGFRFYDAMEECDIEYAREIRASLINYLSLLAGV